MKEAGWNFGMGICNAYLGNDLRATSFNDPCKVGALPVGTSVEQSGHYFQIIFQTFFTSSILVQILLWKSIIGYTAAQLIENYKKFYILHILDLTKEMSALSVL